MLSDFLQIFNMKNSGEWISVCWDLFFPYEIKVIRESEKTFFIMVNWRASYHHNELPN